MSRYWLGRLLQAIPLLIGISVVVFAVMRLSPGDPTTLLADPSFLNEQQQAELRSDLGLDEPLPVQYLKTMTGLLNGTLRSFRTKETTVSMLESALPVTFSVAALGVLLALGTSLVVGVVAARRRGGIIDRVLSIGVVGAISFPTFVLALFLLRLFAEQWHILPASGIRPIGSTGFDPLASLPHLVLPAFVTAFPLTAILARYVRDAVRETIDEDYVRTAYGKGLGERAVLTRHVLRNALVSVVSVVGTITPLLLGGAVIVEQVFGLPGIGRISVSAALQRDYPVVMTTSLFSAVLVVFGNVITDAIYGLVDPRIRLSEG